MGVYVIVSWVSVCVCAPEMRVDLLRLLGGRKLPLRSLELEMVSVVSRLWRMIEMDTKNDRETSIRWF